MDEARSRMTYIQGEPPRERVTSWQSVKMLGFIIILLGPVLPLTVFLWRLAVGG